MANDVEISENTIGGDAVGRDKIVTSFHVNFRASQYLEQLYEKLKAEPKSIEQQKFIEELQHYISQADGDVLGLEEKFKVAGRIDRLWYAKELKERYYKKLLRTSQFSLVGQKINVYLLALIRTNYLTEVYPKILENETKSNVDMLVNERIVKTLLAELGDNQLEFTSDDVLGMVYYLTGNCHLKWS